MAEAQTIEEGTQGKEETTMTKIVGKITLYKIWVLNGGKVRSLQPVSNIIAHSV